MPSERLPPSALKSSRRLGDQQHGARDGRQVPGLGALVVVLDQLDDLLPDDGALVGLGAPRDALLEQLPVDGGLALLALGVRSPGVDDAGVVGEHLEAHELLDVGAGEDAPGRSRRRTVAHASREQESSLTSRSGGRCVTRRRRLRSRVLRSRWHSPAGAPPPALRRAAPPRPPWPLPAPRSSCCGLRRGRTCAVPTEI